MATPIVCPRQPLPRDLDVNVSISRPVTEIATDMSLMCFLTKNTPFPPGNGRVRYYSTFEAVEADFASNTPAWWAANTFFRRAKRPSTMAIGGVWTSPIGAGLISAQINVENLQGITNGEFDIVVNEQLYHISGLNFAGTTSIAQVAGLLSDAFSSAGVPVEVGSHPGTPYNNVFISTTLTGEGATLDYVAPADDGIAISGLMGLTDGSAGTSNPAGGVDVTGLLGLYSGGSAQGVGVNNFMGLASGVTSTDVATLLGLTEESGAQLWQGYTPVDLVTEAGYVAAASKCNGRSIYGWTLEASYRDTDEQKRFADWAEARVPAYFSACTNAASAYDASSTTNIGYYISSNGFRRSSTIYHHNPQVYPDVSYCARAISPNYNLPDSAITMKFEQLDGIEPSNITETMLAVLNSRNINCYVAIGNNSNTVREGVQGAPTWYTDTLVNLDNFREELQVEVYNVFLRTPKVPYTSAGQDKLISAAGKICRKYTRNGVFAPRDVEDETTETGYTTLPATSIIPVNVAFATMSERAGRIAPPIAIIAYEAGAFHKVTINVDVFS